MISFGLIVNTFAELQGGYEERGHFVHTQLSLNFETRAKADIAYKNLVDKPDYVANSKLYVRTEVIKLY